VSADCAVAPMLGYREQFQPSATLERPHAILGCAVAGMGISLVPRMVLRTFPDAKLLSIHALPPEIGRAPTVLIRRKGPLSPKVSALIDVLLQHADARPARKNGRKNAA